MCCHTGAELFTYSYYAQDITRRRHQGDLDLGVCILFTWSYTIPDWAMSVLPAVPLPLQPMKSLRKPLASLPNSGINWFLNIIKYGKGSPVSVGFATTTVGWIVSSQKIHWMFNLWYLEMWLYLAFMEVTKWEWGYWDRFNLVLLVVSVEKDL